MQTTEKTLPALSENLETAELLTLRYYGENMYPVIQHGDYLKIKRLPIDPEDAPGCICYFVQDGSPYVAYLFESQTPGRWLLRSASEEMLAGRKRFEDYEINPANIEHLFQVKMLCREFE